MCCERHIRALFSAIGLGRSREVERAERRAMRDRQASLESMVALSSVGSHISAGPLWTLSNQSVSGEFRIRVASYKDQLFSAAVAMLLGIQAAGSDGSALGTGP